MLHKHLSSQIDRLHLNDRDWSKMDIYSILNSRMIDVKDAPFLIRYYTLATAISDLFDCLVFTLVNFTSDSGKQHSHPIFDVITPLSRQYQTTSFGRNEHNSAVRRTSLNTNSLGHPFFDKLYPDSPLYKLKSEPRDFLDALCSSFSRLQVVDTLVHNGFYSSKSTIPVSSIKLFEFNNSGPITFEHPFSISRESHFLVFIGFDKRIIRTNRTQSSQAFNHSLSQFSTNLHDSLNKLASTYLSKYDDQSTNTTTVSIPVLSWRNFLCNLSLTDCASHFGRAICFYRNFPVPYEVVSSSVIDQDMTYTPLISQTMERDISDNITYPNEDALVDPKKNPHQHILDSIGSCLDFFNGPISKCLPGTKAKHIQLKPIIPTLHSRLEIISPNIPIQITSHLSGIRKDELSVATARIVRSGIFESSDVIWRKLQESTKAVFIYGPGNNSQLEGIVTLTSKTIHGINVFQITAAIFSSDIQPITRDFAAYFSTLAASEDLSRSKDPLVSVFTTRNPRIIGTSLRNFLMWPRLNELPSLQCFKILHTALLLLDDSRHGDPHIQACFKSFELVLDSLDSYERHIHKLSKDYFRETLASCKEALSQLNTMISLSHSKSEDSENATEASNTTRTSSLYSTSPPTFICLLHLVQFITQNENIRISDVNTSLTLKENIINAKETLEQHIVNQRSSKFYTLWCALFEDMELRTPNNYERILMCVEHHYPPNYLASNQGHYNPDVNALTNLLDPGAAFMPILEYNNRTFSSIVIRKACRSLGINLCC